MRYPLVQRASAVDRGRVLRTITLGFSADPIARWIWPDADTYLSMMPRFAAAFGGKAFDCSTAYVAEGGKAAALWLPPGQLPASDVIERIFSETAAPEIAADLQDLFQQMDDYHPSNPSCWYLPMIAADPAHMRKGLGNAILCYALRHCDEDGAIAYLESSNPANLGLYHRHGFREIGVIEAGSSPPMYPMVREPRSVSFVP